MEPIDLLWWGDAPPSWDLGRTAALGTDLEAASGVLADLAATAGSGWLLLWDPLLDLPDPEVLEACTTGSADVVHAGLLVGTAGLPEEHDYIHPIWSLARDAGPELRATSWRASLSCLLVRAEVVRTLGSIDVGFHGATGAGLEFGRRCIDRGAVIVHDPDLVRGRRVMTDRLDEHDRFLFLRRTFQPKWVRYAAVRRSLQTRRPRRVRAGLLASASTAAGVPSPAGAAATLERPPAAIRGDERVSVVLPTLGRYELLGPVLDELANQTLPPHQVVVVDQNDASARDEAFYDEHRRTLPLEVVFQDERGQWISRNEAVRRTTGDYLAFVDDDSSLVPDFLERHLEGLYRYDADLTTGASLAVVGAPVPANYAFFRVADQWDSGNGLCHRSLIERFGLFDEQFDRQRRGDAEFGLRVQLGGGLVVHVPGAIRTHHKAEKGGLRSYGSWDGFRAQDRSGPLPLPSMRYYTSRYHTPRQAREDLLIGLSQAIVPYELKRRATPAQWAGFVARELVHLPSTVKRIRRSGELARQMADEGPRIGRLDPR